MRPEEVTQAEAPSGVVAGEKDRVITTQAAAWDPGSGMWAGGLQGLGASGVVGGG